MSLVDVLTAFPFPTDSEIALDLINAHPSTPRHAANSSTAGRAIRFFIIPSCIESLRTTRCANARRRRVTPVCGACNEPGLRFQESRAPRVCSRFPRRNVLVEGCPLFTQTLSWAVARTPACSVLVPTGAAGLRESRAGGARGAGGARVPFKGATRSGAAKGAPLLQPSGGRGAGG